MKHPITVVTALVVAAALTLLGVQWVVPAGNVAAVEAHWPMSMDWSRGAEQVSGFEGPWGMSQPTPDARWILLRRHGNVSVHELPSGRRALKLPDNSQTSVSTDTYLSSDGRRLVTHDESGRTTTIYDAPFGETDPLVLTGDRAIVRSPDARRAVMQAEDLRLELWDWETGEVRADLGLQRGELDGSPGFSANGRHLVAKDRRGRLLRWDADTGAGPLVVKPPRPVDAIHVANDGGMTLLTDDDVVRRVLPDGAWGSSVTVKGPSKPYGAVFLQDGRYLQLFEHPPGGIRAAEPPNPIRTKGDLWDADTGRRVVAYRATGSSAFAQFSFNRNGSGVLLRIMHFGHRRIQVPFLGRPWTLGANVLKVSYWDLARGKPWVEQTWNPPLHGEVSPDGRTALQREDNQLKLVDLLTGQVWRVWPHTAGRFLPDGRVLLYRQTGHLEVWQPVGHTAP